MVSSFNIRCCNGSTQLTGFIAAAAIVLAMGAFGTPGVRPGQATGQPGVGNASRNDGLPNPAEVVLAYDAARRWVDAFSVPPYEDPSAHVEITGATGVCVTLRRQGQVVGQRTDTAGDDLMLRRAVGRAMSQSLTDSVIDSLRDILPEEIGPRLVLEVEVAGELQPLIGGTFERLAAQLQPGRDGVAIRRGDEWVHRFPSQMRAYNASRNLVLLLGGLGSEFDLPIESLQTLREEYGVSFYSFPTTHLTQAEPDAFPYVTLRGETVVPQSEIDGDAIAQLADGVARHVLKGIWSKEHGLGAMGGYRPTNDDYLPTIAPPFEQTLLIMGLNRYAASPGVNRELGRAASVAAQQLVKDLAKVAKSEMNPLDDPRAAAGLVLATSGLPPVAIDAEVADLARQAAERVWSIYNPEAGFIPPVPEDREGAVRMFTPATQALLAAAMARLSLNRPADFLPETAARAVDDAWKAVELHEQIALLPWIGWAEMWLADALDSRRTTPETYLKAIRKAIGQAQITRETHPADPDLFGGFAVTATQGIARPTSQLLRPVSWLARAVNDPRWVAKEERQGEMRRLLRFCRFLKQLAVRDEHSTVYPNIDRSAGGIRNALWDADQPVAAQALALLTLGDLLGALEDSGEIPQNDE